MDKSMILKCMALASTLFSFALLIAAFVSCNKCYTEPCWEGDGLKELWRVGPGYGFQAVTSGLVSFLWGGLMLFYMLKDTSAQGMGSMRAFTLLVLLMNLQTAGIWGSQATLVQNLADHLGGNGARYYEYSSTCSTWNNNETELQCVAKSNCIWDTPLGRCVQDMTVANVKPAFDTITAFACLNFIVQTLFVAALFVWASEIEDYTEIDSPNYNEDLVRSTTGEYGNEAIMDSDKGQYSDL